jgi:hypothetical protein
MGRDYQRGLTVFIWRAVTALALAVTAPRRLPLGAAATASRHGSQRRASAPIGTEKNVARRALRPASVTRRERAPVKLAARRGGEAGLRRV